MSPIVLPPGPRSFDALADDVFDDEISLVPVFLPDVEVEVAEFVVVSNVVAAPDVL